MSSCNARSENFVDMDDSNNENIKMLTKWKIYGLLGIILVLYSTNIIIKSKPEYVKKLWVAYIILAAIFGFIGN